jgi:hypothetical protein
LARSHEDDIGPQVGKDRGLGFGKACAADHGDIDAPPRLQVAGEALAHQPDAARHEKPDLARRGDAEAPDQRMPGDRKSQVH